jgi:hypothetical protein
VSSRRRRRERVGVGSRGKYPGAPPHRIKKEKCEKQAEVVKGERLKKKQKKTFIPKWSKSESTLV